MLLVSWVYQSAAILYFLLLLKQLLNQFLYGSENRYSVLRTLNFDPALEAVPFRIANVLDEVLKSVLVFFGIFRHFYNQLFQFLEMTFVFAFKKILFDHTIAWNFLELNARSLGIKFKCVGWVFGGKIIKQFHVFLLNLNQRLFAGFVFNWNLQIKRNKGECIQVIWTQVSYFRCDFFRLLDWKIEFKVRKTKLVF